MNGALLDELVLAPLLETSLRAEPCEKLYATDASPSGAGGCVAPITEGGLVRLVRVGRGERRTRLDWEGDETPSSMRDGRAAAAPLALQLSWATFFSYRFFRRTWSASSGGLRVKEYVGSG